MGIFTKALKGTGKKTEKINRNKLRKILEE